MDQFPHAYLPRRRYELQRHAVKAPEDRRVERRCQHCLTQASSQVITPVIVDSIPLMLQLCRDCRPPFLLSSQRVAVVTVHSEERTVPLWRRVCLPAYFTFYPNETLIDPPRATKPVSDLPRDRDCSFDAGTTGQSLDLVRHIQTPSLSQLGPT